MRQRVFRRKKLLLSFEHFVVAGFAFLVAIRRYCHSIPACADGLSLLCTLLLESYAGDEGIGNLTEGTESRLLILQLGFFRGGLCLTITARESSSREQRTGSTCRQ